MSVTCSIYVGGLDVLELKIIFGSSTVYVKNNDASLVASASNLPGLATPWYDKETNRYGATFATDNLALPGE